MNKKKTNRLVAILDIIPVLSLVIYAVSKDFLMTNVFQGGDDVGVSIYNSAIIDLLINKIAIITIFISFTIGLINLCCSIQNKQNKKICFWFMVIAIFSIWMGLSVLLLLLDIIDYEIINWIYKIIFTLIPIVLSIINLALIKKHKPKAIQIISYIAAIIFSLLGFFEIIPALWIIVAVVMLLIYIHYQDNNIEESKSKKIVNVLLYNILHTIISVGFLLMIISALLISLVNDVKWTNELNDLFDNITELQGNTISEVYIPVENNYKYGFIDEKGIEKISCQYDKITYFNKITIYEKNYYIALAMKDNKFYIISKTNNAIELTGSLGKYIKAANDNFWPKMIGMFNNKKDYRIAYVHAFQFLLQVLTKGKTELEMQMLEDHNDQKNKITLIDENSQFICKNTNYTMIIKPLREKIDEKDYEENYYTYSGISYYDEEDNCYYLLSDETKYEVTIANDNEEERKETVYLPGLYEYDDYLETFSNGFIEFENEEKTRIGWFDNNGNVVSLPNNYYIEYIKDDKVFLRLKDDEDNKKKYDEDGHYEYSFIIIDMTGKILLQTSALGIYSDMYLIKNDNKKMVLLDKELQPLTNEYDKIITNMSVDITGSYSSYY